MDPVASPDVVLYACTCGLLKPIPRLYFCRHCEKLRCGFCVGHEIDSLFCGKCLDNRTSKEAAERKNKCLNCFICPSCQQQLSSRGSTVKNSSDPKESTKVVYLTCLWCRWTTREVGMPDQPVGSNRWPERENVYANRLHDIQDRCKAAVLSDMQLKIEKDKKRTKKYVTYTERTGVTAAMIRKKFGIPDVPNPHLKSKAKEAEPAIPHEEVDDLPVELLTTPIILTNLTTIEQRLGLPDHQPTTVNKLCPVRKQLLVKQSLRCRQCEHIVSKPEFNPNSIKFKIQLFAYYHIPEVRIFTVEPLRAANECDLLLIFVNPTQFQTAVKILPLAYDGQEGRAEAAATHHGDDVDICPSLEKNVKDALAPISMTRQHSSTISPRKVEQIVTADLICPPNGFVLPARDETAEFDEGGDSHYYQDDPKLVVHRKGNKATIRLRVTPDAALQISDEVIAGFTLEHIYTNTIATRIENKEPSRRAHHVQIFLKLGRLVGSN